MDAIDKVFAGSIPELYDRLLVFPLGGLAGSLASKDAGWEPALDELRASGVVTLNGIADALNERSIPTSRNKRWAAAQVARVLERIAAQ